MAEACIERRGDIGLVEAEGQLQLAGPHHRGEHPVEGAAEETGAEGEVGREGEGIGEADLLAVGGGELIGEVGEVLILDPRDVDHPIVLGVLGTRDGETEAVEGVPLAQEAVVIAHVHVFGVHLAAIGDDPDEEMVGPLGEDEVAEAVGAGLEAFVEDLLAVELDDDRRRLDDDDAVLELVALGGAGAVAVALLKRDTHAGRPGMGFETAADIAEGEAVARLDEIIEAAPRAKVEGVGEQGAPLGDVGGDGEVEVHADAEDRGTVGDRQREEAVVDLGEVVGVVDHPIEAQGASQGEGGGLELNGTAHPILLPPVDRAGGDAHHPFGHILEAEGEADGKGGRVVGGLNPAGGELLEGDVGKAIAEDPGGGGTGDVGVDVVGELLSLDEARLTEELDLHIPYPFIVDKEVEEVESIVVGDGAAFADHEEVCPEVIITVACFKGTGVEDIVLILGYDDCIEDEGDGRDQGSVWYQFLLDWRFYHDLFGRFFEDYLLDDGLFNHRFGDRRRLLFDDRHHYGRFNHFDDRRWQFRLDRGRGNNVGYDRREYRNIHSRQDVDYLRFFSYRWGLREEAGVREENKIEDHKDNKGSQQHSM